MRTAPVALAHLGDDEAIATAAMEVSLLSHDPADGAELAVRPLDGHPGQALLGFSAPMGWTAIGVSSEGWAGPYQGEVTGYSAVAAPGTRRRVRAIVQIDRDGSLAGCARWRDGGIVAEAPTDGFVVDCLRRALGLGTPPPTTTTDTLFAALWLEGVEASVAVWMDTGMLSRWMVEQMPPVAETAAPVPAPLLSGGIPPARPGP